MSRPAVIRPVLFAANRLLLLVALAAVAGCSVEPGGAASGWQLHIIDDSLTGADGVDLFDVDADGYPDAVAGWEESRAIRFYRNPGGEAARSPWLATDISGGLEIGKIEDARFYDSDGDGRIEAVFSAEEKGSEHIAGHWLTPAADPGDASSWQGSVLPSVPSYRYIKLAMGDLDGDGINDLVAGAKTDGRPGALVSLHAPAATRTGWQAQLVDELEWVDSLLLHDLDGDGYRDILVNHIGFLGWYRNPGRPGEAWQRNTVAEDTGPYFAVCSGSGSDAGEPLTLVAGADLTRHEAGGRVLHLLRQDGLADGGWSQSAIHSIQAVPRDTGSSDYQVKGLACGALDDDPRPDVAVSISGQGTGLFALMNLDTTQLVPLELVAVADAARNSYKGIKYDNLHMADVDGDGDLDLVTTEENGRGTGWLSRFQPRGLGVVWYENPLE